MLCDGQSSFSFHFAKLFYQLSMIIIVYKVCNTLSNHMNLKWIKKFVC